MHSLCLSLGYPHPDYLDFLTVEQFHDWCLYYEQVGGFGPDRNDVLYALLTQVVYDGIQAKRKPKRDVTDWMVYRRKRSSGSTSQERIDKAIFGILIQQARQKKLRKTR